MPKVDNFVVGVPYLFVATVDFPPTTSVTFNLPFPCFDFPTLTFAPTTATLQGLFTPISACFGESTLPEGFTVTGADAAWYTPTQNFSQLSSVQPRAITFSGSFSIVSGQPSSQILAILTVPGNVVVTPFASGNLLFSSFYPPFFPFFYFLFLSPPCCYSFWSSGCTFSPLTLNFNDTTTSLPFAVTCDTTAATIPVTYIVTGSDARLYGDLL